MPISPEPAPVAAAGEIERHHAGYVIGVLELFEGRVGIGDSCLAIKVIVIGRNSIIVRVGYSADALEAVVGERGDSRDAVERGTGDGSETAGRHTAAVGVSRGLVLRILA